MKSIPVYLVIGVTLLWCATPAQADDAGKSAKAGELLQLVQGDQMIKALEPMMKGMLSQADKDTSPEQRARVGEMQEKIKSKRSEVDRLRYQMESRSASAVTNQPGAARSPATLPPGISGGSSTNQTRRLRYNPQTGGFD